MVSVPKSINCESIVIVALCLLNWCTVISNARGVIFRVCVSHEGAGSKQFELPDKCDLNPRTGPQRGRPMKSGYFPVSVQKGGKMLRCTIKQMGVEPPDAIGIDKTEAQLLVP